MDAKQLYRYFNKNYELFNWLNADMKIAQNDSEVHWIYCGINDDFKNEIVKQYVNDYFEDQEVYLCISPTHSSLVNKSTVDSEIKKNLHKTEIGIIDKSFTKVMHFTKIGVFAQGIIRDFPKERDRPQGQGLKVEIHANVVDSKTSHIPDMIEDHFAQLEKALNKDYGGAMENLWIDLELVEGDKQWPFRFQKRVSVPASFTEPYSYNVGHYSVQPDYDVLKKLSSKDEVCAYIFSLLYQSTKVLEDKQKKIGGFDAASFRTDFFSGCKDMGYLIQEGE